MCHMPQNGAIKTQSFYRVMQSLRLRLPKFDARIQGVRISAASLELFKNATSRIGQEEVTLAFDPELRHDQLQRMLINPQMLGRNLEVIESTIRLNSPKGVEAETADLIMAFGRSLGEGMTLLHQLKQILVTFDFDQVFKAVAVEAVKGFGPEGVHEADFEFIIQELIRLADHELIQKVVSELMIETVHDQFWPVWALALLREAFPHKAEYHQTYADIAFKLEIYDEALDGYQAAAKLAPNQTEPQAKKSQPPPAHKTKKRKISRGGRKRQKASQQKNIPHHLKQLRAAERGYKKQIETYHYELRQKVRNLWSHLSGNNMTAVRGFLDAVARLGEGHLRDMFPTFRATPRQRLARFNLLRDEAETQGREFLADIFHDLGNEMLGDIIERIARGRLFKSDPTEGVTYQDPSAPGQLVQGERPQSLAIIDEHLDKDLIEAIDQKVVQQLFEAVSNERHPQHAAAAVLLNKYVWKFKREADADFNEYQRIHMTGKMPDGSLLDRSVDNLKQAVARFAHPALVENLATMIAMQGQHLLEQNMYEPARAKFDEALKVDSECFLALERRAKAAVMLDEYAEAIELSQSLLDLLRTSGDKAKGLEYMINSAHEHIGFAASQLHILTHDRKYLTMAKTHLQQVSERKSDPMVRYCLTEVYFSLAEFDKGFKELEAYLEFEPELKQLIALSSLIWANLDVTSRIPAKLYDFFTDYFLSAAKQPLKEESERYINTYAIYLFEYGLRAGDAQAIASAVRVLDHFADSSRFGSTSYYHAHYALAQLAYLQSDYRRSRSSLEKVLEAEEIDMPIYSEEMKAWTPLKANAFNMMTHVFRRLAHENGRDKVRTRRLLKIAQGHAEAGLKEFPDEPVLLYNLAQVHQELKHYSEAARLLDRLHELSPQFINGYLTNLEIAIKRSQRHPDKMADANRLAQQLGQQVKEIARETKTNLNEIERITMSAFFHDLMMFYGQYGFKPALDLLRLIQEVDTPFDLRSVHLRTITQIETEGEFTVADEIRDLVREN